jgi:hypothetical protein
MLKQTGRRAPALCALLLASGAAWSAPTYEFNIRGTTLDAALKQFAAQSGLQVAYFTKVTRGRMAPTVSGTLTAEEAMRKLLDASGLTFERIDDSTLAIHAEQTASGAAADSDRALDMSSSRARTSEVWSTIRHR